MRDATEDGQVGGIAGPASIAFAQTAELQPSGPAPDAQPIPVAESYSGTIRIVFSPAVSDVVALSTLWDALDSAAGVGKVIAHQLLRDGSGHEFTLDLGED